MLENEHMATDKIMTKRKYSYMLITAVLSFIVGSLPYIIPFTQNVVLSEEKQMLFKKIEQEKFQKFVDSINDIQDLKTQEQTYRNISTINDLMNGLARELSISSAISIYYSHDSGGVPYSGSRLNITILYSADNKEPCLG